MVLVGIVVWIILNRHKFGAHVYLIGDNEDSARLMGVNVGPDAHDALRPGRRRRGLCRSHSERG